MTCDLILQRARAGRHDHPLARLQRRHEVRERLAGAGPGLDDQRVRVVERAGDRAGHLALLGTIFVVRDRPLEAATRRQQVDQRDAFST
ncbi:MAG: hypothetical protein WKG01_39000 [Kofleriaceae bacterium]